MSKALAIAVISQAYRDITEGKFEYDWSHNRRAVAVAEAKEFLTTESEDLQFWCDAAELDMKAVIKGCQTVLNQGKTPANGVIPLDRERQ